MSNDKPIIKDNRLIKVTGVYGKDNQLQNYKPSAPVKINIMLGDFSIDLLHPKRKIMSMAEKYFKVLLFIVIIY